MTDTPNLALPYILAAQAQKHVTHNEAIRALDCLVQLSVADRSLTAPPATPEEGSRYIVAADATGDWIGQESKVAAFQDGAWAFYAPKPGWLAWVSSENVIVVYEGSDWAALPSGGGGGVTDHGMLTGLGDDDHLQYLTDARGDARYTPLDPATLGINATADTTNRLALKSPASLFDNEGAGHQQKINKATATDTASVLYQTNYSGRAEMGLAGDDDFHFKVSADGSTWHEAIVIDKDTGKVSCPLGGPTVQFFTSSGTWTKPAGCVRIKATIVGGGGGAQGGATNNGAAGGGGGAGAAAITFLDATSISSLDVTIGAGGAGGSGSTNGSSGGTSGLGTANANGQATGGAGGSAITTQGHGGGSNSVPGGLGGTATSGTLNFGGASGTYSLVLDGASSIRPRSGNGASSIFGGGGKSVLNASDGVNGSAPGAGGSGASAQTADQTGGNGADGAVIIEEYYA